MIITHTERKSIVHCAKAINEQKENLFLCFSAYLVPALILNCFYPIDASCLKVPGMDVSSTIKIQLEAINWIKKVEF